jgi:hypothetical protein
VTIRSSCVVCVATALVCAAQDRVIATIDGEPLRASDANRPAIPPCERIASAITTAAQAAQRSRLGISAPPQELRDLKAAYLKTHDLEAEAKKTRDDATALVTALTEIYEHGMDRQQAYQKYLAPRGYPENAWQANLIPGKAPEWRAKWAERERITAKMLSDALEKSFIPRVEQEHLDAAVDQQIAARDPQFKTYLEEQRLSTGKSGLQTHVLGYGAHLDYLLTKRFEWWQAREAEVKVVIYDPALARECAAQPPRVLGSRGGGRRLPSTLIPLTVAPVNPQR